MKRYYKDVYYEPTFKLVTTEEYHYDLEVHTLIDPPRDIDLPTARRVCTASVHPDDMDQIRFFERYADEQIIKAISLLDYCDYYIVEV
jgi:hypothetical protein